MFNCVPTIEAVCMLVSIHLHSASQQLLVVALMTLSTIEIHMVPYKYNCNTFLQFPTLAGESPKWTTLVVTWALVICLKYTHSCHVTATLYILHHFFSGEHTPDQHISMIVAPYQSGLARHNNNFISFYVAGIIQNSGWIVGY